MSGSPCVRETSCTIACIAFAVLTFSTAATAQQREELERPVPVQLQHEGSTLRGQVIAWDDEGLELRHSDDQSVELSWRELGSRQTAAVHGRVFGATGGAAAADQLTLARRLSRIDDTHAERLMQQALRRTVAQDPSLREKAEALIAEREQWLETGDEPDADDEEPTTPERLRWPELTEEEHAEAIAEHRAFAEETAEKLQVRLRLFESDYFLFCTDMEPREAEQWYRLLDRMYRLLMDEFGVPRDRNIWRGKALVLAFNERDDYHAFYRDMHGRDDAEGTAGRCHYLPSGSVYVTLYRHSDDRRRVAGTLVHEAAHGFAYRYRSRAHIPSWLSEGIAEWAKYTLLPELKVENDVTADTREKLRQRGSVEGMFDADPIEFWQYDVAYTLTQFMLDQKPAAFVDFFHAIKDGKDWEPALEEDYGVTVDQLLLGLSRSLRLDPLSR